MKFLKNNPELKRNLLIEFSPFRLAIMPIVLLVIFYGVFLVVDGKPKAIFYTATTFFYLIAIIWGTKMAADSMIGEFNEGTWDSQKMTLLSPWEMTVGKLLGSTSYAWYGGAICLLVAFVSSLFMSNSLKNLVFLVTMPLTALSIQAFAIMIAISLITQNKNKRKLNSSVAFIIPLILGLGVVKLFYELFDSYFLSSAVVLFSGQPLNVVGFNWWFIRINPQIFSIFTAILFAFWGFIGAYAFIRREMSYKNSPKYFLWFIFSMCVYYSGISVVWFNNSPLQKILMVLSTIFVILLLTTYFCIFYETKDPMQISQSLHSMKLDYLIKNYGSIPRWTLSGLMTLSIGIILILFLIINSSWSESILTYLKSWNPSPVPYSLIFVIFGFMLLLVRDISLVLSLNFSKKTKNPGMAAILYILLLYSIAPMIAYGLVHGSEAAFIPFYFLKNESLTVNFILLVLIAVQTFVFLKLAIGKYSESISFLLKEK